MKPDAKLTSQGTQVCFLASLRGLIDMGVSISSLKEVYLRHLWICVMYDITDVDG